MLYLFRQTARCRCIIEIILSRFYLFSHHSVIVPSLNKSFILFTLLPVPTITCPQSIVSSSPVVIWEVQGYTGLTPPLSFNYILNMNQPIRLEPLETQPTHRFTYAFTPGTLYTVELMATGQLPDATASCTFTVDSKYCIYSSYFQYFPG